MHTNLPFMTIFTIELVKLIITLDINGIPGTSLIAEFESSEAQSVHPLHYSQSQRAGKSLASCVKQNISVNVRLMLLIGKAEVNDGPGVISNNEACVGTWPAGPVGRGSENGSDQNRAVADSSLSTIITLWHNKTCLNLLQFLNFF